MLAVKGNITTFQALLDGERFDLTDLDETSRLFFETEFYGREYESTRKEISWRVWSLLKNETMRKMFTASTNECQLDLSQKLILIDTDIDILQDYSGMFGRFFLAQILQVAHARFTGSKRPLYVYIDECYFYLDRSVTSMLETARKADIGLILAHQYISQITEPKTASALMALTSTKFAAQLSPSDAHSMAQAMRTTADYINALPKLNFALWQRGEQTASVTVPVGVIEAMAVHAPPPVKPLPPPPETTKDKLEFPAEYIPREPTKPAAKKPPAPTPPKPNEPVAESGDF
jgi:hypothetical protein